MAAGDTAAVVTMVTIGAAIFGFGTALLICAITGKGFARNLEPRYRARQGCSAVLTMLMGAGLIALILGV